MFAHLRKRIVRCPATLVLSAVSVSSAMLWPHAALGQPVKTLDLAATATDSGTLQRVYGADGSGSFGVPVAGGSDVDGDGEVDYAVAYMTADPLSRNNAGEVDLIFGDGRIQGEIDTAVAQERVLRILGDQPSETAGSEIWMADVTGDGLGDLLICRQNYSPSGSRSGAGALTIVVGSPQLRAFAQGLDPLDLRAPPPALTLTHVWGALEGDRLCIWTRTGDVTGDGIDDVVVGADQEDGGGQPHRGAVYVLMGGPYLADGGVLDLASRASPPLSGRVARVVPPAGAPEFHLGATCQVADLDGDGAAEVLAAATLNRAGAVLAPSGGPAPHGSGGVLDGAVYVLWDDNFVPPWPAGFELTAGGPAGSHTVIRGGDANVNFGEELLGGLDYDADGEADLFVGDLTADGTSGIGYVFYDAAALVGLDLDLDALPPSVVFTKILGPGTGAIGADTAAHGDFDRDGVGDLAFCSPKASPRGRADAGVVHVLQGRAGGWPASIDTAALPSPSEIHVAEILGAEDGDILCYSAAAGDVDGDGTTDLIVNEMKGDTPSGPDIGNLILIDGLSILSIFSDGFESGDTSSWSVSVP